MNSRNFLVPTGTLLVGLAIGLALFSGRFAGQPGERGGDLIDVHALLPANDATRDLNWVDYRLQQRRVVLVWLDDGEKREARVYAFRKLGRAEWKAVATDSIPHDPERLSHVVIDGVESAMLINDNGLLIHSVIFEPEP